MPDGEAPGVRRRTRAGALRSARCETDREPRRRGQLPLFRVHHGDREQHSVSNAAWGGRESMIVARKHLARRTLLRGLGTAIALPWLDAMSPAFAGPAAAKAPVRLAFVYVPNGIIMR